MSMHHPSQTPGGSEPPLPGPVTAVPGPKVLTPHNGLSKPLLALLVVAALLTFAIPGFFVFGLHGGSSTLFLDRHGMPSNIPLPGDATFKMMLTLPQSSGTVAQEWYWTVDSPNVPNTVVGFYQDNLRSNGWTHIQVNDGNGPADVTVSSCQGSQVLFVEVSLAFNGQTAQGERFTVKAPEQGSALRIETSTNPRDRSFYCS